MRAAGALLNTVLVTTAVAADKGAKEEAVALTKKAIAFYKANGKKKAYAVINNKSGQFVDRDLYVYVVDTMRVHDPADSLLTHAELLYQIKAMQLLLEYNFP